MSNVETINTVLRDFVRYTGDGKPNAPVSAPLPTGDPRSGVHNLSKADLRAVMIAILQTQGDPEALERILNDLGEKADASSVAALRETVDSKASEEALSEEARRATAAEDQLSERVEKKSSRADLAAEAERAAAAEEVLRDHIGAEVEERSSVIAPSNRDEFGHIFTDAAGFISLMIGPNGSISSPSGAVIVNDMLVSSDDFSGLAMTDPSGFVLTAWSGNGVHLPKQSVVEPRDEPPLLYIGHTIAVAQSGEVRLFSHGIFPDRLMIGRFDMALIGGTGASSYGDHCVTLTSEELGSDADLIVSPKVWDGGLRSISTVSVSVAPVPANLPAPYKVLMIGDSITNRQGVLFVDRTLSEWGYLPEWIGTMRSSASPTNTQDANGPLAEAREGWECGDYTFDVDNRGIPVPAGGEAAYLTMPKGEQWTRNPLIRTAAADDASNDVRNGYVMDFGFYLSRFALEAPDMVILGLGTNDVRDLPAEEIRASIQEDYELFIRRIRADLPAAKILIWLPGTARDVTRDILWSEEYIPMIGGIMDAVAASGDANTIIAPIWAMTPAVGGYQMLAGSTDTTTGTRLTSPNDAVHPVASARAATFSALAAYVAAAAAGTI